MYCFEDVPNEIILKSCAANRKLNISAKAKNRLIGNLFISATLPTLVFLCS